MHDSLSLEIQKALHEDDPLESGRHAKRLAAKLFEEADSSVEVKCTDYFNNTYTPDIILNWKGVRVQREIFLRTTQDLEWIFNDIKYVPSETSTLLQLDPDAQFDAQHHELGRVSGREVSQAASQKRVFVTEVRSLEHVGRRQIQDAGVGLFSSALLRGGQGYLDDASTPTIVDQISSGFVGAQHGDKSLTASALDVADSFLSRQEDQRITEVLQALWVGGGSDATQFPPSETAARADLDPASLHFLLENRDLTDSSFWARLARSVDIEALLAVGSLSDGSALDDLMAEAASRLRAKACAIRPNDDGVGAQQDGWTLQDGLLSLRHRAYRYFIAQSRRCAVDAVDESAAPDNEEFLSRVLDRGYGVLDLSATDGTRRMSISGAVGDIGDLRAENFEPLFDRAPEIQNVTVRTPWGRRLSVDLPSSTVYGRANTRPYLSDLVETGAELLVGLTSTEIAELRAELGSDAPLRAVVSEEAVDQGGAEFGSPSLTGRSVERDQGGGHPDDE